MTVTVAFKKIPEDNIKSKIIAKAIKLWTKSDYFHCEIIIKNKWISSSPSAGAVYIRDLKPLKENWDYVTIDIDGRKVNKCLKFLESQVNKKYDIYGLIFSTIFNFNIEDRDKWFCSELVSESLKILGLDIPKNANEMTPGDVYKFISEIEKY